MDSEAIEGELSRLRKKFETIKEIEFAIKFYKSNGSITADILENIKKSLK